MVKRLSLILCLIALASCTVNINANDNNVSLSGLPIVGSSIGDNLPSPTPLVTPIEILPTISTGTIQGRVVDAKTGLGVADVRVEVVGVNPSRFTTTDSSGNFTIVKVPAMKINLSFEKIGYIIDATNGEVLVEVHSDSTVTTPEIKLLRDTDAISNSFILTIGGLEEPRSVAVDSANNALYVVSRYGILGPNPWGIKKFNLSGGYLGTFKSSALPNDNDYLDSPRGIAVDNGGNVLIIDSGRERIVQYSATGTYIQFPTNDPKFPGFDTPNDIAVLKTNEIIVSNSGRNSIDRFYADRSFRGWLINATITSIKGMAVDANDNFYVIDGGTADGIIKKIDPATGKVVLSFGYRGGQGAGYFENPTDLAIDNRNGDIYVVDSGNNRIQRFNLDGSFLAEFGGMGSVNGKFNAPSSVAVDSNGYVYVADTNNNRIQKFAPSRVEAR